MTVQAASLAPPLGQCLERHVVLVPRQLGGPAGFELEDQPMPTAENGQVRVRVLAACVQFSDVIIRNGKYPGLRQAPPFVLGTT